MVEQRESENPEEELAESKLPKHEIGPRLSDGEKQVVGEWEKRRRQMPLRDAGDQERLRKIGEQIEEKNGSMSDRSRLSEATIGLTAPLWLGALERVPIPISSAPTAEFDDHVNNIDNVREVLLVDKEKKPYVIRWGEDVTRIHSENGDHYSNSQSKLQNKVAITRKYIEEPRPEYPGVDAGRVKYMFSPVEEHFKSLLKAEVGPITTMPRVVISFPDEVIADLAYWLRRAHYTGPDPEEEKKVRAEAVARLDSHPAKVMYLTQVLVAMEAQIAFLKHKRDTARSADDIQLLGEALGRAERVADYINLLLGESQRTTGNQWLDEAYEQEFGQFREKENGTA